MTAADQTTQRTIEAVWRIESARLIAGLAHMVRDVGLAEEFAQDALVAALEQWPSTQIPDNPGAWLMATAKRRGIDHLRRNTRLTRKLEQLAPQIAAKEQSVPDYVTAYRQILQALTDDPNVDIVVGISDPNSGPTGDPDQESQSYDDIIALAERTKQPIVLVTPLDGEPGGDKVEQLIPHGVLLLSGFPEGFRALERLVTHKKPKPGPAAKTPVDAAALRKFLQGRTAPFGGQAALDFLAIAGIPTARGNVAANADAAVKAARSMGFPVVLKNGDEGALHKTDTGGVHLNLNTEQSVGAAANRLREGGAKTILVQAQVRGGVEMIVALQTDPALGAFVLVEAIIDVISRIDSISRALGARIQSIDINPLIALPNGALAVDALIVPSSEV